MIFLRIVTVLFILFASSRVFLRFREKSISRQAIFFWLFVWAAVLVLVFHPDLSNAVARFLGMGRGIDSVFFLSIVSLFYLIFRLYVKIEQIDKDITTLSKNTAKALHKINKKSPEEAPQD